MLMPVNIAGNDRVKVKLAFQLTGYAGNYRQLIRMHR